MQRYKFSSLVIELTRKCNLACRHCMHGDAEDLTISREIMDKIFENVGDCSRFSFTGGEPRLALDEMEYFVDRIIESGYSTDVIDLVTNGTILDRRIVQMRRCIPRSPHAQSRPSTGCQGEISDMRAR